MVRLTNPEGKVVELTEEEYTKLLWKFVNSNSFKEWERQTNLIGSYMHNGKHVLNRLVIQVFFRNKGYKLEKNIQRNGGTLK